MRKLTPLLALLLVLVLPAATYLIYVAKQIEGQSEVDEAQQADVIVVLGAAEYNGLPSPVLRARLDHAFELHRRMLAPLVLTTGGSHPESRFSEGQVGRNYLVRKGIPAEDIMVEAQGDTTVKTLLAVSEIMKRNGLSSAILVSDGYHIYRAKAILEREGITAYGSPRPQPDNALPAIREHWLFLRQAVGYVLWRVGIPV